MKKNIICISDGKIGHLRQSQGLATALSKLYKSEIITLPALNFRQIVKESFLSNCPLSQYKNSVVIGAGHKTHSTLLLFRYKYHCKTIVLMKPSFPKSWFSYCVIPRHDKVTPTKNTIISEGALNTLSLESTNKTRNTILILVGGLSDNCQWSNEVIYRQIEEKIQNKNHYKITLSTSRRTPSSFLENLPSSISRLITVIPFDQVDSTWLPLQLLRTDEAWISSESVSMIYEALSADCNVSLLDVPKLKTKIRNNIQYLKDENYFNSTVHSPRLNESQRIADLLIKRGLFNDIP